ncbi:MAG: LysM peptidoglycan-binding domain-containing protein, partial [Acidobacteriota bacterium]
MSGRPDSTRPGPPAALIAAAALAVATACGGGRAAPLVADPGPHPRREPGGRPATSDAGGVYHTLRRGQTLYALSRAYGVPVETLIEVNRIADVTDLPVGAVIFIPGARRTITVPASSRLRWPLKGRIT